MKNSTSLKVVLLIALSCFMFNMKASAQSATSSNKAQLAANQILKRTSVCIYEGQKWEIVGKIYTDNLAKAIQHQQYACKLYAAGDYANAIIQSHRARLIVMDVIRANKGNVNPLYQFTENENKWLQNAPDDQTLDAASQKNSTMVSMKDSDYATGGIADIVPGE
ncbi:MAG: hypothetical protein ABI199_00435 [Bacteroidia bacterium]